jgi:hypothetical protein
MQCVSLVAWGNVPKLPTVGRVAASRNATIEVANARHQREQLLAKLRQVQESGTERRKYFVALMAVDVFRRSA